MIQNYTSSIKEDFTVLYNKFVPTQKEQPRNERVQLAAGRVFASFVMGMGIVRVLKGAVALDRSTNAAVVTMATGALLYALGHDLFVVASNLIPSDAKAAIRNGARELGAQVTSAVRKAIGRPPANNEVKDESLPLIRYNGTLLKPVYVAAEEYFRNQSK
jgi:hypothetical protein